MKVRNEFMSLNNGISAPEFRIVRLAAPVRLALQALAELARAPRAFFDAAALAGKLGLPAASLSKCLQALARRGLLQARRGPGGGYRLAVAPGGVTLATVVQALGEGRAAAPLCLMEERPCSNDNPCRLHAVASSANERVRSELERINLGDLL